MLIAHRGDRIRQPENTIAAFEAAHGLGACAIATDVQLSAEGTPWCCHHSALQPVAGGERRALRELNDGELCELGLLPLSQLVDWALRHPYLDWFLHLKPESIDAFGCELAVQNLVGRLPSECESFALLADDCRSLRFARSLGCHRVALKVSDVARSLCAEVVTLAPDYLLIRDSRIDCEELPPGPWQWVVYEINAPEAAVHWRSRGAHHILTGNLPLLMRSREASDVYGF